MLSRSSDACCSSALSGPLYAAAHASPPSRPGSTKRLAVTLSRFVSADRLAAPPGVSGWLPGVARGGHLPSVEEAEAEAAGG